MHARLALALIALTACGEGLPDASDAGLPPPATPAPEAGLDTLDQTLICGAEDWDDLDTFADQASWLPMVHYGKAAARIGGCSATLYDDRWLVTADHCSIGAGPRTVFFGKFAGADDYGRDRLRDLGMAAWEVDQLDFDDFAEFTCSRHRTYHTSSYGYRDVEVWRCDPNDLGRLNAVFPGDIWGHVHISPGRRPDGRDLYAVTVNRPTSGDQTRRILLSPTGEVNDGDDDCAWDGDYDNCFEHNVDTRPGSSGGGIFERSTKRLIGVVNGNGSGPFDANECNAYETNYGAYLPASRFMPSSVADPDPLPALTTRAFGGWVGGYGGTYRSMSCPAGKMAAGIIGTTYRRDPEMSRRVGNFGIVCVPYRTDRDQAGRSTAHWDVVVGGSIDHGAAGTYPFDVYINETLDAVAGNGLLKPMRWQQQGVTMCPPGDFLSGVEAFRDGGTVGHVDRIICRSPTSYRTITPRLSLGDMAITPDDSNCGFQRYADGINIRSGWLTDGFQLRCRNL